MKWIIVIVVVLVVAAALYLRTVRTSGATRGSTRAHRLDDSLSSSDPVGLRAEPSPHAHIPPPAVAEEAPGSDFAREPEISDPPDEQPPTTGTAAPS